MNKQISQLDRLDSMIRLVDQSYVKPEELSGIFEAFTSTISTLKDHITNSIKDGDEVLDKKLIESNNNVAQKLQELEKRILKVFEERQKDAKDTKDVLKKLSTQISEVKSSIPSIPEIPSTLHIEKIVNDHELKISAILTSNDTEILRKEIEDIRIEIQDEIKKEIKKSSKLNPGNGPMLHTPALSNLPDVNVAGITSGQTIQWNGTAWVAVTPSSGGSGFTYTDELLGTGDDSTISFALAHVPTNTAGLQVFGYGGFGSCWKYIQNVSFAVPYDYYVITTVFQGNTIASVVFNIPPQSGVKIFVSYA